MKYKNLILIGTSHIAKQSIDEIKKVFKELDPDIVTLELDRKRLGALVLKSRNKQSHRSPGIGAIFRFGLKGYIFFKIGEWAEKKLGEYAGVSPGTDMLTAFKLAKKEKKKIALIDQEIEITLKRLSKAITWKEKWNFFVDIFKAVILRKKEIEAFDLRTVPSQKTIDKMMSRVKKKYPNVLRVLVTERNKIMAKRLAIIMKQNPESTIMAIVGAGHEREMIEIIKKRLNKIEVVYSNSFSIDY